MTDSEALISRRKSGIKASVLFGLIAIALACAGCDSLYHEGDAPPPNRDMSPFPDNAQPR